jgi:hypothetical protein
MHYVKGLEFWGIELTERTKNNVLIYSFWLGDLREERFLWFME